MTLKAEHPVFTQSTNIKYQGRKTNRVGAEQRRRLILEAALRIVIREGVRGIRHRAVAKEAEVPLAATTYYFKDIQELINDTFTLYAEHTVAVIDEFSSRLDGPSHDDQNLLTKTLTDSVNSLDAIADNISQYVIEQITQHRDALIAEQAFRYEAILNPHIRKLAEIHKVMLMNKLTDFMRSIQSPSPDEDANIMAAIIYGIEYDGLLLDPSQLDTVKIRATLRRQLNIIFAAT